MGKIEAKTLKTALRGRMSKSFGQNFQTAVASTAEWLDVSVPVTLSLDTSKSALETSLLQKETLVVHP